MTYGMRNHGRNWRSSRSGKENKEYRYFRLLEKMFYYYQRIKRAVSEAKQERDVYKVTARIGGSGTGHAFVSDPTANAAIRRCEPIGKVIINAEKPDEEVIASPEKWMTVVEQTMLFFADEELIDELLRRRFFKNEAFRRTCIELEISEDRYYRLLKAGMAYARECAIQLGLIKVFDDE